MLKYVEICSSCQPSLAAKAIVPAAVALSPALLRAALKVKVIVPQSTVPGGPTMTNPMFCLCVLRCLSVFSLEFRSSPAHCSNDARDVRHSVASAVLPDGLGNLSFSWQEVFCILSPDGHAS